MTMKIQNINTPQNNNDKNSKIKKTIAKGAVVAACWEAMPYVSKCINYPINKFQDKQIIKFQNGNFIPYIRKAIEENFMYELSFLNINPANLDKIKEKFGIKDYKLDKLTKIKNHILHTPYTVEKTFEKTAKGENAIFINGYNLIIANLRKNSAIIFHEMGHRNNEKSKNVLMKMIRKIKHPLRIYGPSAVALCTLLTPTKDEDSKKKNVFDFIKNNCGKLTALVLLPTLIEESFANINGLKIAKSAGVTGELLKKVKNINKLSIFTYATTIFVRSSTIYLLDKLKDAGLKKINEAVE